MLPPALAALACTTLGIGGFNPRLAGCNVISLIDGGLAGTLLASLLSD